MEKLGIADIKALSGGVAKLGSSVGKILEDGAVDFKDLPQIPGLLAGVREVSRANLSLVLPEVKDLDEAEKAELAADFSAKFDLPNDSVEGVIEQGYAILLEALEAILSFQKIGGLVKAAAA